MAEYYNIFNFNERSSPNAISNILNSTIDALNKRDCLPRLLVVVLDKEIIETLNFFDFGATRELAALVNWLTRQIDITIWHKRLQITEKKPGAVNINDPLIIFTTMIRRPITFPQGSKAESICSLRRKFNEILNEAVARQGNNILTVKSCDAPEHFDRSGKLSTLGRKTYWEEIDYLIERFDHNKVKLFPKLKNNSDHRLLHHDSQPRRKMPTPPPRCYWFQ